MDFFGAKLNRGHDITHPGKLEDSPFNAKLSFLLFDKMLFVPFP